MAVEDYTMPERSTERGIARRQMAKVTAAGGCLYCANRVEFHGLATCDLPHRTFPRCLATPGMSFEPDYEKLGECHAS